MHPISRILAIVSICCTLPAAAWAEADIRPNHWSRGTTLNGFAGVSVDDTHTGAVLGGAVAWDMTPRFALEGSGSWLEFGGSTNAFAGAIKIRGRLAGQRTIAPFVLGGVGLYRASFGPNETRMPGFFARRLGAHTQLAGIGTTFTDPTVVGGAGVNIHLNRRIALRPDVEAIIVLRDRRSHVVTSVALHAVYQFESRPVTPMRKATAR